MPDTREVKGRLEARLLQLQLRLRECQETLREPENEDLEEQAMELDEEEVLERLAHAARDEITLIRAALDRIDRGTYGLCSSCGSKIARRRLEALPETTKCLECAREPA